MGKLLMKCGFEYWDLGMDLEYKQRLGAEIMRRSVFVSKVKRSRVESKGLVLQCGGERKNAKELVDWGRPITEAMDVDTKKNGKKKSKKGKAKKGGNNQTQSDQKEGKAKTEGDEQPQSDCKKGTTKVEGDMQPDLKNEETKIEGDSDGEEDTKQPDRKRPHKAENGT